MGTCTSSKTMDDSYNTMLDPEDQQPNKESLPVLPNVCEMYADAVKSANEATAEQQLQVDELMELHLSEDECATETSEQKGVQERNISKVVQVLQNVCKMYADTVKGAHEATERQQSLVDKLMELHSEDECATETSEQKVVKGRNILKDLQNSLSSETFALNDTAMEFSRNTGKSLRSLHVESFDFDILSNIIADAATRKENKQKPCALMKEKKQKMVLKEENEIDTTKESNRQRDIEIKNLEKEPNILKDEIEKPKKNQETIISKTSSTPVQVFSSHSGDKFNEIVKRLKDQLKSAYIHFIDRQQPQDIDTKQKLIVISLLTTRTGTDAENAIKKIESENLADTALVLIHIKEKFATTEQKSIGFLTDKKFKDLGGIFDLVFVNGKGYDHCKMNNESLEGICSFVKS